MKTAIPRHIGIIPDGNRRWAAARGLTRTAGYANGVEPGLRLTRACREAGIEQLSVYGFTQDNVRRPADQVQAFREACVLMARELVSAGATVRVVGQDSPALPSELRCLLDAPAGGAPKVNLLCNYDWRWDLEARAEGGHRTSDIPPLELIVRWGGGRRLSGFLPVQSVYADIYVVDQLWPDFSEDQLARALEWYAKQDRTLGG